MVWWGANARLSRGLVAVVAILVFLSLYQSGRLSHELHAQGQELGLRDVSRIHPNTRRELLGDGSREATLVARYIQLHDAAMALPRVDAPGINATAGSSSSAKPKVTLVVCAGDPTKFWAGELREGVDASCNVPCNVTYDRKRDSEASIFAVVLDRAEWGDTKSISPPLPTGAGESGDRHVLGITLENNMGRRLAQPAHRSTQLPFEQRARAKGKFDFSLIATYELDSLLPILYPEFPLFVDEHKSSTREGLTADAERRHAKIFVAISNCHAAIVPNRLSLAEDMSAASGVPLASFGRCLEDPAARREMEGLERGSGEYINVMRRHLWCFVPENSYGTDYVTEKVWHALRSGCVPIYMGAPNVAAFLPSRDAVVHVQDFPTVDALANYIRRLTKDRRLLVEKHQAWREAARLPQHMYDLERLSEKHAGSSFACRVCHCARGHLGCPSPAAPP
mmetsp:Transcript_37221/g.72621  ORF Transcript_37221/g.72621 Transcript_37221/m.72621 type:complete len:452 (+) Transcript_37221:383-1738(+)